MLTKKLLLGGTAAVGTVATGAVVTNKYGFPSSTASRETEPQREDNSQEENKPPVADQSNSEQIDNPKATPAPAEHSTRTPEEIKKQNLEDVKNWLKDNKGNNSWQIKIKNGDNTEEIENSDLDGLPDYLNKNTPLLKSIAGTQTTFTFRKNESGVWENIFTKEQILAWVKSASGNKATLKLSDENQPKELDTVKDLNKLFGALKEKEGLFNSGLDSYEETRQKTILFWQDEENWKHYKSEIDGWLIGSQGGDNKVEIKIKKGDEDAKTLDSTDEGELIGLLKHLKENKTKLLKYKSPKEGSKVALTLKKEQNNWKLIYKDTTNDWVSALGEKVDLKLYGEGGNEKPLSGIAEEGELEKLFNGLNTEDSLGIFKKFLEGQTNSKIVVFEDYNADWTHIKEAMDDFLSDKSYTIKIKINDSQEDIKSENVKDDDLIGLMSHLETNGSDYANKGCLVLKKNGNNWAKIDETCK